MNASDRRLLALVVVTAGLHAGCANDDSERPKQTADPAFGEVAGNRDLRPSSAPQPTAPRAIRADGGAVVRFPVRPDRTKAPASPACTQGKDGDGSGSSLLPPRPGVRATRNADRLRVEIFFERVPERCKPSHVRLTVDVNDDPLPPATAVYPMRRVQRPLVIQLPERVVKADVLHASTVTSSGASSDSATVLIVDGPGG
jgi:hypothetical protein